MKMYLHQSWTEIILTLNWIPRNPGEMVGAWFACFFSAIFVQVRKNVFGNRAGFAGCMVLVMC